MTRVRVPCPACGGVGFRSLYAATIGEDEADVSVYFGSSRARAGNLHIVRCTGCGLVMTNPQDDGATLARVYANHEDAAYEFEYASRRRAALWHLDLVTRYLPEPVRILDVGCATGIFVGVAQEAGWQATGIDASAWMVSHAQSRCPMATFRVANLEKVNFPAESFQVITLWDVLEHVHAPVEMLERAHGWLTQEGWLFLSVPNVESKMARLMGKRWVLLLREHLWYFSPRTIGAVLSRAGFEVISTRTKLVEFSLANVMGRLGQYGGSLSDACSHLSRIAAFKRVRLRFPMGEMDVVARVIQR
jgi:ubiquinone/menaquinone biosynthesis C-methylase UbiE